MSTATLEAPVAPPPADADPMEGPPRAPLTINDFEELPDNKRYELVDGELVERGMSTQSSGVAVNCINMLGRFVRSQKLGRVFGPDCGYILFPGRSSIRFADVSFVSAERIPKRLPSYFRLAPDFAFEAASPTDKGEDIVAKVEEYLRAGVRLVWVAYPRSGVVHAYRPDGSAQRFAEGATLAAEDVFPGWSAPVAELFAEE